MLKADLIKYLAKIPDDEPLFLLRAQDALGVKTVNDWAAHAMNSGQVSGEKVNGAMNVGMAMGDWQRAHPERVKMPD